MKTISIAMFAAFALAASGCVVHHHDHRPASRSSALKRGDHNHPARSCHPSQYWNGHRCIHKGKGHGARKHDD